jgi:hypothetical protein
MIEYSTKVNKINCSKHLKRKDNNKIIHPFEYNKSGRKVSISKNAKNVENKYNLQAEKFSKRAQLARGRNALTDKHSSRTRHISLIGSKGSCKR